MKVVFNKKGFVKDAQQNWLAPRFDKLREGNLGEWLLAFLFVPTLGLVNYPIAILGNTSIKLS